MRDIYDREELQLLEDLHIAGWRTASVIADLEDKGPLYEYIQSARVDASNALEEIAYADVTDTANIAKLQGRIRLFIDAISWSQAIINNGKEAAEIIKEEFDNEREDYTD